MRKYLVRLFGTGLQISYVVLEASDLTTLSSKIKYLLKDTKFTHADFENIGDL